MFGSVSRTGQRPVRLDGEPRAEHVGTTSLIEDDVYDSGGKCLGEVEEVILDIRTGCVRYVVLALGGFLGIGRQRVAVPWSALTFDLDYQRCALNVTEMQLMAVPVFDEDLWLQRYQPARRTEILPSRGVAVGHSNTREA